VADDKQRCPLAQQAMEPSEETSLLELKLDAAVPIYLTKFDAFAKLSSTYKQRSGSRGLLMFSLGLLPTERHRGIHMGLAGLRVKRG